MSASKFKISLGLTLLCLIGVLLSYYSLIHHIQFAKGVSADAFCNINQHFNCDAVNGSAWSSLFGIPVASYGLFFYLFLLALFCCAGPLAMVPRERAYDAAFVLVFFGCTISIALFLVSEFVLGAICLLCLGTYIANFALLALLYLYLGKERSLGAKIRDGIGAWTSFLMALCGCTKARAGSFLGAWSGLLAIGVLGVGVFLLEDVISFKVKGIPDVVNESVVDQWLSSPTTTFSNQTDATAFGDYQKGTPGSSIQIVEFADFECPACRRLHLAMKDVLKNFSGSYQMVFRNYPLDMGCNPKMKNPLHQYACFAAELTRCAGEQGKFWESLDSVFENPILDKPGKDPGIQEALISSLSTELGLDIQGLKECLASDRQMKIISRDLEAGDKAGLQSTPSVWVNGRLVSRPTPENLTKLFNHILGKS